MTRLEMVEKVKEKTGVTYDEAHEALSRSGWDIYDALIEVGRKGGGSTAEQKTGIPENAAPRRVKPSSVINAIKKGVKWLCWLFSKGEQIRLEITRDDEEIGSVSLTVLILLLMLKWWIPVCLIVLGIFIGFRYRVSGLGAAGKFIEKYSDKASEKAEELKSSVRGENE